MPNRSKLCDTCGDMALEKRSSKILVFVLFGIMLGFAFFSSYILNSNTFNNFPQLSSLITFIVLTFSIFVIFWLSYREKA